MAEESLTPSERPLEIDRRELLASAAGMTASGLVPNLTRSETGSLDTQSLSMNVSAAKSLHLSEIWRRNELRREAKLPVLEISKEWRRLKTIQHARSYSELFGQFEAAHRQAVWDQVLKPVRQSKGDVNWRPKSWSEGIGYQTEVYRILRERFEAERRRCGCSEC